MRTAGIVVGCIVVVLAVLFFTADMIVSRVADKQIRKVLQEKYDGYADFGRLRIRPWAGMVTIDDVAFSSAKTMELPADKPGFALRVGKVSVRNIDLFSLIRKQQMPVCKLKVKDAQVQVVQDAKNKYMNLALGVLEVDVHGIGYNLADSSVVYNDSVYRLQLSDFRLITPDSLTALELGSFRTENGGPLMMSGLHVYNTVDRRELAVIKGCVPETWADMSMDAIVTTPVNLIRQALSGSVAIDSVRVTSKGGSIFRDARFPPKVPFPMPQEVISQCPIPITIGNVAVQMNKMDIEIATTHVNSGNLSISDMNVEVKDVSTKKGAAIHCLIHDARIGKSRSKGSFTMHLDKDCTFETRLMVRGFELSYMDSLLCPLIGITASADVDTLRANIRGDKVSSTGDFCMIYHDFNVEVHKDVDVPYHFITKNAGFVEGFANTMLPKQNPPMHGHAPRAYQVEWKRNEMAPFPLYMFGPVIDGAVKTFLPGLFLHKKIKEKDIKPYNER